MRNRIHTDALWGSLCVLLIALPIWGAERRVTHDGGQYKQIADLREQLSQRDATISTLNQTVRGLQQQVQRLQRDLQQAKEQKARIEGELAAMKATQAQAPDAAPKPSPKRDISLSALAKMNVVQIRNCAGCRFTGRMPVLSVEPIANAPGKHRITTIVPLPDGQPTTQPDPNQRVTRCIFEISIPVGLTVAPQKGVMMAVAGDIKQVVTLPAGDENPKEVQVYLAGLQSGP